MKFFAGGPEGGFATKKSPSGNFRKKLLFVLGNCYKRESLLNRTENLFTREFVVYCAVMFLTFWNMAVFFQFNHYLQTLGIDQKWSGFIIGAFSLTALIVRPIISPFLHESNSRLWIIISAIGIIICLCMYNFGTSPAAMLIIRICHGLAYVVMATAVLSGIVAIIPANKSAQAFSIMSALTLLPFAIAPPLLGPLSRITGDFASVLDLFGLAMFLVFPLAVFGLGGKARAQRKDVGLHRAPHEDSGEPWGDEPLSKESRRISWSHFLKNISNKEVVFLLLATLALWSAFTVVFYFLKDFALEVGVVNAGLFFTLSTISEIGVRFAAGSYLDRFDKTRCLALALIWLILACVIMSNISDSAGFYIMGVLFGLGWGIGIPLLSGLMFDISPPDLRGLNTNLSMEMFQGGYFVGPLVGSATIVHLGAAAIFWVAALINGLALICVMVLIFERAHR
jgi:MFS family permease